MRFVVLNPANKILEAGAMPTAAELIEMNTFNQELMNVGVMLTGEGLHPTSKGARIHYNGDEPVVIAGPFAKSKELIAGFWLVQGTSLAEVVERFKRAPVSLGRLEIRRALHPEDFEPAVKTEAGRTVMDTEVEFRKRANT